MLPITLRNVVTRELVDGLEIVCDLVCGGPRVRDLEIQHRIDVDHQIVLGDNWLRLR